MIPASAGSGSISNRIMANLQPSSDNLRLADADTDATAIDGTTFRCPRTTLAADATALILLFIISIATLIVVSLVQTAYHPRPLIGISILGAMVLVITVPLWYFWRRRMVAAIHLHPDVVEVRGIGFSRTVSTQDVALVELRPVVGKTARPLDIVEVISARSRTRLCISHRESERCFAALVLACPRCVGIGPDGRIECPQDPDAVRPAVAVLARRFFRKAFRFGVGGVVLTIGAFAMLDHAQQQQPFSIGDLVPVLFLGTAAVVALGGALLFLISAISFARILLLDDDQVRDCLLQIIDQQHKHDQQHMGTPQ